MVSKTNESSHKYRYGVDSKNPITMKSSPVKALPAILPAIVAAIKGISAKAVVGAAAKGAAAAIGSKAVTGNKKSNPKDPLAGWKA